MVNLASCAVKLLYPRSPREEQPGGQSKCSELTVPFPGIEDTEVSQQTKTMFTMLRQLNQGTKQPPSPYHKLQTQQNAFSTWEKSQVKGGKGINVSGINFAFTVNNIMVKTIIIWVGFSNYKAAENLIRKKFCTRHFPLFFGLQNIKLNGNQHNKYQ